MRLLHNLFFKYQKAMWYVAHFGNELGKPLRFYSETLLLLATLGIYGIKFNWYNILVFYIIVLFIACILGRVLERLGVISYNIQLTNNQNPEIKEILKILKGEKDDK